MGVGGTDTDEAFPAVGDDVVVVVDCVAGVTGEVVAWVDDRTGGVVGVFGRLLTSSDFFGVNKPIAPCCGTLGFDGEMTGFALIGAVTFVCLRRGRGDFVTSGLETVPSVSLGDVTLFGDAAMSGDFFFTACCR